MIWTFPRSFFAFLLAGLLLIFGIGNSAAIDQLKLWDPENDASLKKIDYLMDGGSISYQFRLVEGDDIWVLAKNRFSPSAIKADQVIILARDEDYTKAFVVQPRSQLEFQILRIVAKAKTHLSRSPKESHMLDILHELIEHRDSPWPGHPPGKAKP